MSVGGPLARLGLLWRTARHLRPRQLAAQLGHRVRGPARRPRASLSDGLSGVAAHARGWPAPRADGALAPEGVVMLARPPHEPRAGGWTPAGRSALWTYTLHYHGWIARAGDDDPRPLALVERWIADHPRGVGWEPYPTSMRALQWLHLLIRGAGPGASNKMSEETCSRVLRSLAAQLRHLEANLERHLDGNHLWTNLAALASAGLALDGPLAARLRRRWLPALVAVADEQLAGGVHRERAPSYHCLLAHQLGGALWLARRAPEVAPGLTDALARQLAAMLDALPAFTHPDGDVALWGDSQRGAAVTPGDLIIGAASDPRDSFEHALSSARVARLRRPGPRSDAPAAGFFRRRWGPWTALWSAGDVGLPHQVGHIHGDALALELSLGRERVLVDAGVGTYARGPDRAYARATRAHNTVTVGLGPGDQHELWASHRIGARARLGEVRADADALRGSVLGVTAPAWHHRALSWDAGRGLLRCRDHAVPGAPATARYFLPGDVELTARPGGWRARTTGGQVFTITSDPPLRRERELAPGWRGFNEAAPRHCLLAPVPSAGLEVQFAREATPVNRVF